jgi:hypothetical protein
VRYIQFSTTGFTVTFCNYLSLYYDNYVAVLYHFNNCTVHNCHFCIALCSLFLHITHSSTGFQPLAHLPAPLTSVPTLPAITPNISSYLNIQHYYSNVPNFIAKVAPVASHLNLSLLGELSQGFYDTQILD